MFFCYFASACTADSLFIIKAHMMTNTAIEKSSQKDKILKT